LTNSFFNDNVEINMFAQKFVANLRKTYLPTDREKKARRADVITEQVRQVLKDSDQQLILMVRG